MANQQPSFGALPPSDAHHQIGDRADKLAIERASDVFAQRTGYIIRFADMQAAIDAYLQTKG